jgi:hypothetical protein
MQFVCWLGLLGSGSFATDEGRSNEALAAVTSPWLSEREKWIRAEQVHEGGNTVAWLDVLSVHTTPPWWVFRSSGRPSWCYDRNAAPADRSLTTCHGCYGGFHQDWNLKTVTGLGYDPAFAQVLLESLKIRTSDLPPLEKGRRLARLVKPTMTLSQVHALFGESQAFIWDHAVSQPFSRLVYCDYGVTVQRTFREGLILDQKDARAGDDPRPGWQWLDVWEAQRQQKSESDKSNVFTFFQSFCR